MTARGPKPVTLFMLLESLGEDAWQQNLKTGKVCISAAFWASLGYEPGSLPITRQSAQSLLHPIDVKLAQEQLALHIQTQEPLELDLRVRASAGDWRFIRIRGCVTEWDSTGEPAIIAGILNDLTEELVAARTRQRAEEMISTLSNRELQVLECLVAGAANKNIAFALGLSPRTVEGYRARLLDKLGVKGAGELVQVALAAGITRADGPIVD